MTPLVTERWIDIIENDRSAELESLLAEDAVFNPPAVFTPQEGKAMTATYLRAAKVFGGATSAMSGSGTASAPPFWSSPLDIDGIHVNGR